MNFFYAYLLAGLVSTLIIKWTNIFMTKGRVIMNYVQLLIVVIGWPLILPMFLLNGIPNLIENRRRERLILPSRR